MNKKYIFFWVVAFAVIASGCSRKVSGPSSAAATHRKLDVEEINFEYFETKTKIRYSEATNRLNGNLTIRMKKDSIIWMSVSPSLGIEVTRSIITPDTIIVVNRLDKEYYTFNYAGLSEYFNFKIDFGLIQSILMANLPMKVDGMDNVTETGGYTKVSQRKGLMTIESYINQDLKKLETVIMKETYSLNQLSFKYSDFSQLSNTLFPKICAVNITYDTPNGPLVTTVNIEHSKAEISDKPLKFPFNVPDKYVQK